MRPEVRGQIAGIEVMSGAFQSACSKENSDGTFEVRAALLHLCNLTSNL